MAEFIEVLSEQAKKDIDALIGQLEKASKLVTQISKNKINIIPSQASERVKENANATNQLTAAQKEAKRLANAIERERARQTKSIQEQAKELQTLRHQTQQVTKEQREQLKTVTLYTKVEKKVRDLSKAYNELAVKQELRGRLTAKETAQLGFLEKKINKYQSALKKVDANIGKYSRNVGNYASGWNGLANSINQLTREAPAFANSMEVGFIAISNNLPILFDEMGKIIEQNKRLQAEGKKTTSALKQIGAAIFSWQTLLSVGVTLLTLYGKELINWATGMTVAKKATKEAKQEMAKANSEAMKSARNVEVLAGIVIDLSQSEKARKQAYLELQETIPSLTELTWEKVKADKELVGAGKEFIDQTDLYTKAVMARAKADALARIVGDRIAKLTEDRAKKLDDQLQSNVSVIDVLKNAMFGLNPAAGLLGDTVDRTSENYEKQEKVIASLSEQQRKYLLEALELESAFEQLSNGIGSTSRRLKELQNTLNSFGFTDDAKVQTQKYLEQMIKDLERVRSNTKSGTKEFENLTKSIKILEQQLAIAKGLRNLTKEELELIGFEFVEEIKEGTEESEKLAEELSKVEEELRRIASAALLLEHLRGLGDLVNIDADAFMEQVEIIKEGIRQVGDEWEITGEGIGAIAEATGMILNGFAQTAFQGDEIRLRNSLAQTRDYYQEQISLAEGNAVQQDALRAEQQRKEQEIRKKIAENERKGALYDIAINTAVGIVKALAMTPPNVPLSIAIGAIGTAKAALVASQPIPQFKHGRKGGEETWAILGDGYKNEPVIDKEGNLKAISPNKPTMMHLDKGDSVLPDMNRLNDDILAKTMLLNIQAGANSMKADNNRNKALERLLQQQSSNIEKSIIKSLKKAKFVNINNTSVDLGYEMKVNRYKGKL